MKITFQFDNGTSRIVLEPTSARDERYLELVRENKPSVSVDASTSKSLVLKFDSVNTVDRQKTSNFSGHAPDCELLIQNGTGIIHCTCGAYDK